ncbi:MAG TPA: SpoIIE family protein phosphatase, partial [Solirubrobacterales bacterium]|nr:SpoIIE family protein phosphatase [Solirubrobacterales bacterium]
VDRPGELELRRYLRSQRQLAARLLESETLDEVAADFLFTVANLLRWDAGALWEAGEGEPILRFVSGWSVADLDAEPLWKHSRELVVESGKGLPGRAWESGEIAWAPDFTRSPLYPRGATAAELGLSAALAIPIPVGRPEGVLAVAEFHARSFSPPSEELLALLGGFGDQLGTFIARRRERGHTELARNHLTQVVAGTQDAVLSKDLNGVITTWNPAAERLYGYSPEEAIGEHVSFLMPDELKHEEKEILDRVINRGESLQTYETQRVRKDGVQIDVSLTVSRIEDPARGVVGASVVARDITSEIRRRRAQTFMAGASRDFDSSLDPAETARNIVHAAIPDLATVCVIDFLRRDGWLGDSVVAATKPRVAAATEELRRAQPLDPDSDHPVPTALREGRPMIWRDIQKPEVLERVVQSEEQRRLIEETGYSSAATVPLVARGRTLGVLSFLHAGSELRYDETDLEFLADLGDRAAMALDNARLFRERDSIARDLQRGLRPPRPAEVPGLEFSVFYEAAGDGIEIGGDLYDVLPTEDGCWLLIGDVAGKGSAAAGVSVAVRHAVRGLVREVQEPEEVLNRVNEMLLEGDSLNDFATALLIRLREREDGWSAEVASAGHPPAVHVSGGEAVQLGGGAVLGAWADAPPESHETTIRAGDTLVLSTDGWHEAGPVESHRDSGDLAELAAELAEAELDELTAALREDALARGGGSLRDDIIVLAVRPTGEPQSSSTRSRTVVPASEERI